MPAIFSRQPTAGRSTLRVVLLLLLASQADAQRVVERPPLPDSAAPSVVRDSGTHGGPVMDSLPRVYVTAADYRVLLAAAPSAAALDTADALSAMRGSCAQHPGPERAPDGYSDDPVAFVPQRHFVVVVAPSSTTLAGCEERWNAGDWSVWRAISFGDTTRALLSIPRMLRLELDSVAVTPLASVSQPAYEWRGNRWARAGVQLRYYYDMAVLAPRADGRSRTLRVHVWGDGPGSSVYWPSPEIPRRLSDEFLVWRLASLATAEHPPVTLTPARAVGGTVRVALDEAASGQPMRGARRAAAWMTSASYAADSLNAGAMAGMLVAEVLLRAGDSSSALAVVAQVQHAHPCLVPSAGASESVARMASALRAGVDCRLLDAPRVLRKGLAAPGLGHAATGHPVAGALVAAATSATLFMALGANQEATRRFGVYESARTSALAEAAYGDANASRRRARSLLGAALSVWVIDAIIASWGARTHNAEVRRDRL